MTKSALIVIILAVLLIGGGIIYSLSNNGDSSTTATTTPPIVSTTDTNTATPPQAGVPAVVTSTSVFPSDTTVAVTGTVNPKGAFTSYWYEYGTTQNLGSKTTNQTLGSGFASIQAPGFITGLAKNTTYYFKLVGENQYGRVSGNQYSFKTTQGVPAPTGSAPLTKTIAATGVSKTTANINGEVNPNGSATQYWFEYGQTAQLGNTSAFSSVGDGTAKLSASVSLSDLQPLTTYYFRLNAQNQFGTINGSILNFKTSGPVSAAVPTVKTGNATSVTNSKVTLHGTINPNSAETKYWFEYSTDSLLGQILLQSTSQVSVGAGNTVLSIDTPVTGLNANTTYYYRLVAQNVMGTVRGDRETFKTK